MSDVAASVRLFQEGYSCSQALLSVYGVRFGLDRERALKLAGPFGGGMGGMGGTCGAVTGAYLVLGLRFGTTAAKDPRGKKELYAKVREFSDRFKVRNRVTACRELLGHDISAPEGMAAARQKGFFATLCPKFVQDAAEIIEELI